MYLVVLMSGWRRAFEVWPAAALSGVSFALSQFVVSNFIGPHLTDIVSALVSAGCLLVLMKFWKPATDDASHADRRPLPDSGLGAGPGKGAGAATVAAAPPASMSFVKAWSPYLLLVVLVVVWGSGYTAPYLDAFTVRIGVPMLHNAIIRTPPVTATNAPYAAMYVFNWLSSAGTATFVAAVLAALVLGVKPGRFVQIMGSVLRRLALPILTIASVLALAYVMNYSGTTATLGLAMARTGVLFPFFSAFLGWLGVFLTGSDTAANALFGNLQLISARALSLNPVLMASVNSTAGVLGKMVSLQSIAVATAATGMRRESEPKLFLFTLRHSIGLTIVMGLISMLFAYVLTGWMPQP
jgi:lactate permease